jgi:methyl-accepting chemotaxis protein
MKWFMDMKISTKLLTSYFLIAIIAVFIGVVSILNISAIAKSDKELYENITVPISELGNISAEFQLSRVDLRNLLMTNDPLLQKSYSDQIAQRQAIIVKNLESFNKTISSTNIRELYDDLVKKNTTLNQQVNNDIELAKQGKMTEVAALMSATGSSGIASQELQDAIDNLIKVQLNEAKIKSDGNTKQANSITVLVIIVACTGVLIAIMIGLLLNSIIIKPIKFLLDTMNRLAAGDNKVDLSIITKTKDELGTFIEAYALMIDNTNDLLNELESMSKQQKAGNTDVYISEDKFGGTYGVIAKEFNYLAKTNVIETRKILTCIDEFGKGNFEAEIEKFPGKKAIVNDYIEALRKNLKDVSSEINKLVLAAQEGNLSERGNAQVFQGDWAEVVKGLNGLLDAIVDPMQEVMYAIEEMSKGNLDINLKGGYKGDYAKIINAFNHTIATLNEIISSVNEASVQVAAGARQVSDSAQALSQGSTEQASSIEQLTASMEEISTQTKQNAENARQANELALAAKEDAIRGNGQMQGMLKAMDDINESSGNISKIIKVIDEIAFQTNILALNAAVEAARAGQHGKGFAVVAEEVRTLAARSANAAKETTDLIEGSIKNVEDGTKIASDTAAALNQIVEGVTKATNLVGEIATASNEQALAINQVNQGLLQVSEVVQSNSATSEEGAAASEELSSQAELLREQAARFKLKKSTSSDKELHDLNPKVLRMLEDIVQRKESGFDIMSKGIAEAAATSDNPNISLSDQEFGKY